MAVSPVPYVREQEPAYGVAEALSPLIRRVVARNPSPFTFFGTNSFIIGHGEVAVIDPGPALPAHVEAMANALSGERITHILVTHTHLDHSPAARLLQQTKPAEGAKIYGYGAHGALPQASSAPDVKMEEGRDPNFSPDITLQHGEEVQGAGWALEAVFTPGHISNHLCFGVAQEKALITGDHVMGWATSVIVPPDGNMGDYMDSLALLLEREDEIYYPAHGPAIVKPKSFVRALIAHRRMRERQIIDALKAGQRHIPSMVQKIYADIDKRLHGAAAMSMLAHLLHLEEQGIVRGGDGAGVKRDYFIAG